jgi:hypothetical protein
MPTATRARLHCGNDEPLAHIRAWFNDPTYEDCRDAMNNPDYEEKTKIDVCLLVLGRHTDSYGIDIALSSWPDTPTGRRYQAKWGGPGADEFKASLGFSS